SLIIANTCIKITLQNKKITKHKEDDIEYVPYVFSGCFTESKNWLRNFKLEKGNKATDWTPAPEDINAHPFVTKMAEISHLSKLNNEQTEENANAITEGGAS